MRIGIVAPEIRSAFDAPVVGTDADLPRLLAEGYDSAFLCIGGTDSASLRRSIYASIKQLGFKIPNIIDPSAVIGSAVSLGEGIFIGKNAVINASSRIGDCAIINTGAIVEHECVVGAFAQVSPGCVLCGGVSVGENVYVGANSTVIQCLKIGDGALVGAGSVVTRSVSPGVVAFGNPCRERGNA